MTVVKYLFALLLALGLIQAPTQPTQPKAEVPVVNIPVACRQSNWGDGSCVHASMISLLRWQGRYKTADWWKTAYEGGEGPQSIAAKFDSSNIRYAYVDNGDIRFLEWAIRTRRGCGVVVRGGKHMVALVHLDAQWAGLLDNNHVEKFIWVPRDSFLKEWKASGGWAVTPVYSPAAPLS